MIGLLTTTTTTTTDRMKFFGRTKTIIFNLLTIFIARIQGLIARIFRAKLCKTGGGGGSASPDPSVLTPMNIVHIKS